MKQLTRIQAINLKGKSIDAELSPLTAIIGPNAGGKTAIANAITIALLGYVPALGKKPSATVQLMTPDHPMLDIQAVLDDGTRINRRFDVSKKGAVKSSANGHDFADQLNPVQLDFDQFIQAKPTDRQRILESLMVATTDGDVIEDARTRIAKTGQRMATALSGDGWLQALEAEAKDQARLLKQDVDTAAKTILQLSAVEQPAGCDVAQLDITTQRLGECRVKLGQAGQVLDALAEAHQNAPDKPDSEEPTTEAIEAHQEKIQAVADAMQAQVQRNGIRATAEARAREIMAPFASIEPVEATSEPMTGEQLVEAKRKLDEQKRELQIASGRVRTNVENTQKAYDEASLKFDQLDAMECCPTCGTRGTTFKASVTAMFSVELETKLANMNTAKQALAEIEAGIDAMVEAEEAYKSKVLERDQHAAFEARKRADAVLAEAGTNEPQIDLVQAQLDKQRLENELRSMRADAVAWVQFRAAKVPTAAEIEAADKAFRDAKQAVESLEASEAALKTANEAMTAWRGNQATLAELERENEKRASEIASLKELADWAKAKSLEITATAMKPLLDVCNAVLDGIVDGEIAIEGTTVGIRSGFAMMPLEVLSGSEAVAVAAAIQIAIARNSALRIVMIDELSRFNDERKSKFLFNLQDAIANDLVDQVLVFDHDGRTGNMVGNLDHGSTVHVA